MNSNASVHQVREWSLETASRNSCQFGQHADVEDVRWHYRNGESRGLNGYLPPEEQPPSANRSCIPGADDGRPAPDQFTSAPILLSSRSSGLARGSRGLCYQPTVTRSMQTQAMPDARSSAWNATGKCRAAVRFTYRAPGPAGLSPARHTT